MEKGKRSNNGVLKRSRLVTHLKAREVAIILRNQCEQSKTDYGLDCYITHRKTRWMNQ